MGAQEQFKLEVVCKVEAGKLSRKDIVRKSVRLLNRADANGTM